MELIARIPSQYKLRNGQGKYLFKRALAQVLPAEVLTRRKRGFAVPAAEWFRGELKPFAQAALFERGDDLLNSRFLERCWREHQIKRRDWSALLWCVLMFRTWQQTETAL